ncbi:MAG: sulfurtransferase TusA family protein [Candidatus Hydrogenedentes bacterium]|nr:sulfurtransferase TusA family protein [Candidatus Hydrogenedentota bacterium]
MDANELRSLSVAQEVDARGTACPGPLLEAKRNIAECPVDGVMEILSSDEGTKIDITRWCGKMKYDYLGDLEDDSFWRIYLRKTH